MLKREINAISYILLDTTGLAKVVETILTRILGIITDRKSQERTEKARDLPALR